MIIVFVNFIISVHQCHFIMVYLESMAMGKYLNNFGNKVANIFFIPNASRSHFEVFNDQNLHFLWAKTAKNWEKKGSVGGCPMNKLKKIVGQKCPRLLNLCQNTEKNCFATNAPKSHLRSPVTKISIFWGPNYLTHAVTNTAAYTCISLFCNTLLPSGKAVLVFH